MRRRLLVALLTGLAAAAAAGEGKPDDAAAAVDALYRAHFANGQSFEKTLARERARFAPALRTLLEADARAAARAPGEVVGLDFDPLTNSQESADAFKVGSARASTEGSSVSVELRTGEERSTVDLVLVRNGRTWAVANVRYAEGDLVSILKELAAERGR